MTYVPRSVYKVTFDSTGYLSDGMPSIDAFTGLSANELDDLHETMSAEFSLRRGSLGYGESTSGIELAITIASIPANLVGLAATGIAIKSVIEKIQNRRKRKIAITDPSTLAAIGAASLKHEVLDKLTGAKLVSVHNLIGGDPPYYGTIWGTDARHVWAVTFEQTMEGCAFIIFMSPTGLVLGHTEVPLEAYFDGTSYHERTPEDLAQYRHDTSE